jgi:hypothetical protein
MYYLLLFKFAQILQACDGKEHNHFVRNTLYSNDLLIIEAFGVHTFESFVTYLKFFVIKIDTSLAFMHNALDI